MVRKTGTTQLKGRRSVAGCLPTRERGNDNKVPPASSPAKHQLFFTLVRSLLN
jgi:hypothetical protein